MLSCRLWQMQHNSGGTGAAGAAGESDKLIMYFSGLEGQAHAEGELLELDWLAEGFERSHQHANDMLS